MAIFGQSFGAGFGDPDNHIADIIYDNTRGMAILAADGFGDQYYSIFINGVTSRSVWCPEGQYTDWVYLDSPEKSMLLLLGTGQNTDGLSNPLNALELPMRFVTALWIWSTDVIDPPELPELTNWTLSGIKREHITTLDQFTRGTIPVTVTEAAGTVTVTLSTIAEGSGPVGSTITLTELNSSGVSGSVDASLSTVTDSGIVEVRFPEKMEILRDTFSPPTTVRTTERYNSADTATWQEPNALDAGTYYYSLRAISDTKDTGDASTPQEITVIAEPEPPTDIAYVSGNYSNTAISWTASTTPGATYNVYLRDADETDLDTLTPIQTLVAGSTGTTLPTLAFPGTVTVLVRCELGGLEEKNLDKLDITYDSAGDKVDPEPNIASIRDVRVASGTSVTIEADYDSTSEAAVATEIEFFSRTASGSYNLSSPDATQGLSNTLPVKFASATISLANGNHYVSVRAKTAAGAVSESLSDEQFVFVSDENIEAPTGTFELIGG